MQHNIKIVPNEEEKTIRNSTIGINHNQNHNQNYNQSQSQIQKPTAIENEIKLIDKFKERQKIELQALIQHKLSLHFNKKENEEKSKILSQRYSLERGLGGGIFNRTNSSKKRKKF